MSEKDWKILYDNCMNCKKCGLCAGRKNVVFGTGNKDARLMFVGEAPGEQEDLQGIPFVGAAGKLFDKYLYAVGLCRNDVYIANILKCRPPHNRDPKPEEQDMCIEYLREQTRLIKPEIIVCLGRISAMRIIKPDFKITKEHGKWFKKGGINICAIYHPSALLRDETKKETTLSDFIMIKKVYDNGL